MDLLASAKMKATTTVTLFITFLNAVGWSTVEVNAPRERHRQPPGPPPGRIDDFIASLENFDYLETTRMYYAVKVKQEQQLLQLLQAQLLLQPQPQPQPQLREQLQLQRYKLHEAKKLHARVVQLQQQSVATDFGPKRLRRVEPDGRVGVVPELHGPGPDVDDELELHVDVDELHELERELEPEPEPELDGSCKQRSRQNLGDIWIIVGLLTVVFFSMVLTLGVSRNLEKQRKSSRKPHALPIDGLDGATNLPG